MIRQTFQPLMIAVAAFFVTSLNVNVHAEPPKTGDPVEDFSLPVVGSEGAKISLKATYHEGPTVVVVLRGFPGYQCPLCSKQVNSIANRAKVLSQLAHKVILVYPGPATELEQHADDFVGPRKLPEPLVMVRDPDMKMVESWGLRWKAPRETAYPSTFVIDTGGTVVWSKVSNNHAGRSQTEDIIKSLRQLKSK